MWSSSENTRWRTSFPCTISDNLSLEHFFAFFQLIFILWVYSNSKWWQNYNFYYLLGTVYEFGHNNRGGWWILHRIVKNEQTIMVRRYLRLRINLIKGKIFFDGVFLDMLRWCRFMETYLIGFLLQFLALVW